MNFKWPWVTQKTLEQSKTISFNQGVNAERVRRTEAVDLCEYQRLHDFVGNHVIVISNEVSNVTVGVGLEVQLITQANRPVLVVKDVVSGEVGLVLGKVLMYSEQKFNALNKLTPQERIALFYNQMDEEAVDKGLAENNNLYLADEWAIKVREALKSVED